MKSFAQQVDELLASIPMTFELLPEWHEPALMHYCGDSSNPDWLRAMREIETEGERTPAQTEPHPAVMDESTPALLRKQAA